VVRSIGLVVLVAIALVPLATSSTNTTPTLMETDAAKVA